MHFAPFSSLIKYSSYACSTAPGASQKLFNCGTTCVIEGQHLFYSISAITSDPL